MPDAEITVSFDAKNRLSFVQGEDRTVLLQLKNDNNNELPIDLTGCFVSFALPRATDLTDTTGSIKRRSGPLLLTGTITASNQGSVFTQPSHGLVTGDYLRFQPAANGALPAPLSPDATYSAVYLTENSFSLVDAGLQPVVLTDMGTGRVTVLPLDSLAISNPMLGQVTLPLSANVTRAVNFGQGQACQLNIIDADGHVRIVILQAALDVFQQACP